MNPPPGPPQRPEGPDPSAIDRLLADARTALDRMEYLAARDHAEQVLFLEPDNQAALDLKQEAEAGLPRPAARVEKPEARVELTVTPGIPARPDESQAAYNARAARIRDRFQDARNSLEKEEFARAISDFESVAQDQPGYNEVESLIADAKAKRQKAVDQRHRQRTAERAGRQTLRRQAMV